MMTKRSAVKQRFAGPKIFFARAIQIIRVNFSDTGAILIFRALTQNLLDLLDICA
jgi:hypothetical protein